MNKNVSLESKLLAIRLELLEDMTKSGKNKYSNYDYFQLKDFIPQVITLCSKHGVYTKFWVDYEKVMLPTKKTTQSIFNENGAVEKEITIDEENFEIKEFAYLKAVNLENPEEIEIYKKETANVRIQGAQDIQNHGGKSTYMKRYMYMDMFEIVENDFVEENTGKPVKVETKETKTTQSKPATKAIATKKVETPVEKPVENPVKVEDQPTMSGAAMTMDHKVELSNYMRDKGLDPRETIIEAAKEVGTEVPLLEERHFDLIKEYIDKKVGSN